MQRQRNLLRRRREDQDVSRVVSLGSGQHVQRASGGTDVAVGPGLGALALGLARWTLAALGEVGGRRCACAFCGCCVLLLPLARRW